MGKKIYNPNKWKTHKMNMLNKALKEQVSCLEKENQKLCEDLQESNMKNIQLKEELERFKNLYQEVFEETIRLRHSEHKEKSIGEAIENELKRIIRRGSF